MNTIADRISRHLLKRIRRLAVLELYQRASDVGLLTINFPFGEKKQGIAWQVSGFAASGLAGDTDRARRLVGRALKRAPTTLHDGFVDHDGGEPINRMAIEMSGSEPVYQVKPKHVSAGAKPAQRKKARSVAIYPMLSRQLNSPSMFALLREFLPPPNPMQVAVALLIARAVGESVTDLDQLLDVLMRRNPVILLKIPVTGFERQFGAMLEEALIAPFFAELTDIRGDRPLSERFRDTRPEMRKRKIVTASGRNVSDLTRRNLTRYLSTAILGDAAPLVIVDETSAPARPEITAVSDIVLQCAGIDQALITDLLHVCLGIPASESCSIMETMCLDPNCLGVDDLGLAVRPGRTAKTVLGLLASLAEAAGADENEDDDKKVRKGRSSNPLSAFRDKPKNTPIDMILPEIEPSTDAAADKPNSVISGMAGEATTTASAHHVRSLRVEHLSGYGEARPWALDLKDDLALWREGALGWHEMSTKLMLSGPPGTGKTTFARALCNTIQVPLIVTSVASWLEPGFLGDVLQQMSQVFETAREHAPCIVFIDELDAIGSRGGGRGGDDRNEHYWTTLITRLLELLDGALKTEGIIVFAATNLPDRIDPALLRSGRLEKHVIIPPPDAHALAGILAHHLGSDLASVLASAPEHAEPGPERKATHTLLSVPVHSKSSEADAAAGKGSAHV
ncbi:ATPase family protein associated with various cellular activities (AAA) (plasmid) [Hoeflea sp. IMCC20628]|uniref:AAA family ATPase n=1 Tax=Hoeflea sp. IMCC20628 TaxID=1620421 RepID=UPI00063BEE63|nr:ATP-binding protein [Hoeflea sp. IMCC20628]AKI03550.1 ATPase family protein associated with various cellular activities (AAA) [Hoeflea sp. IMCC20628]